MGAISIDEYRIEKGLEPIGLEQYVNTPVTLVKNVINPPKVDEMGNQLAPGEEPKPKKDPEKDKKKEELKAAELSMEKRATLELKELRMWRRAVLNDFEKGRELRINFETEYVDKDVVGIIRDELKKTKSKLDAKILFDSFIDPEIRASYTLLEWAKKMKDEDE
jgi:hypothetical protein